MTKRKARKAGKAKAGSEAVPARELPEPAAENAEVVIKPPRLRPRPRLFAAVAMIYGCWVIALAFLAWRAAQVGTIFPA